MTTSRARKFSDEALLDALARGPVSTGELARTFGVTRQAVLNRLKGLELSGLATRTAVSGAAAEPARHIRHSFPWGVLLVTDSNSTEEIPEWRSDEEPVTSAESALVVRVRHAQEGEVSVSLWVGDGPTDGVSLYATKLRLDSGTIRISDALGEASVDLAVEPGRHDVLVVADSPQEAGDVHIVLDPVNSPGTAEARQG